MNKPAHFHRLIHHCPGGRRRLAFVILGTFLVLDTAALATEALVDPATRQPIVKGDISNSVERRLREAFPIARQRLLEQPACGRLFEPFGKDGTAALAVTRYLPATLTQEHRHCRHASAMTAIRSPVTWLCRSFARLPNEIAAQVLIHEALHYAGMPESPADPEALDSAAINELVAKSCRRPRPKTMRRP